MPLQWATSAVLTVVMSVVGYHLVEKPAIDLGARLTSAGASERQVTNQSLATPRINPSAQPRSTRIPSEHAKTLPGVTRVAGICAAPTSGRGRSIR